jgi:ZIP family zinc transporter
MAINITKARLAASATIPIVVLAGIIALLLSPGSDLLRIGTPLPDVAVERIEFDHKLIIAHVRNVGPETIEIAQADVNNRIVPAAIEPSRILQRFAEGKLVIPFDWVEGKPYEVGITTQDGVRFARSIPSAVLTPEPYTTQASLLALLGTYVGVIPVMIGLLWLPFLKRLSSSKYLFFLSFTAGLLLFLGIDALVEANDLAVKNIGTAFNAPALIATVTVITFMSLQYASRTLLERSKITHVMSGSFMLALMIAIGIGLHNLGEGLAIGGAMVAGEVALGTFLVVGFTIHNTTEGLAIAAALAREKSRLIWLGLLGFIAGAPAILGAWIGGFVASPLASVIFLAVGAGAVFQVVHAIFKYTERQEKSERFLLSAPVVAGIALGLLVMYFTSLLV